MLLIALGLYLLLLRLGVHRVVAALGVSPVLRRSEILLEYEMGGNFVSPSWASVRSREVQYIEYYDETGEVIFRELYDLLRDEWQLTNLLELERDAGIDVSALSNRLWFYRSCSGSVCP